ncbi:hypothetical protein LC092_03530 [Stappia stellulata]|uniref:hypothetical protein n=1 Tax=Stappia TaxID=152161 RepID=UPI001CD66C7C|nr:hypothetical protein [Stappia stellulata]MCA1241500.1 hypothetical protein [Stappia stellulata]
MQTDDPPSYRFTAKVQGRDAAQKVEMAYVIERRGLSVMQGRAVRLVPWTSLRFLHLHVTSGVGTTGFPVYSARLRTRFMSWEISSLDWLGETAVDRSAEYVRFMEELIPVAAARNPLLRLRYGGDPLLETVIPLVLSLIAAPLIFLPFLILKVPAGFFAIAGKNSLGKLVAGLLSVGFAVVLHALPWSSGKPFEAHDLPAPELPMRYRKGAVYKGHVDLDQR